MPDVRDAAMASDRISRIDAVVVGAGFAGLYMLHRLRGLGLSARVFEAGSEVGGTWYWNRYPGARCDIESLEYSYSFDEQLQQSWCWTERYAAQPEILRYARHVADRFDLRRDITFDTRVAEASFDAGEGRWTVRTDAGEVVSARFCIMATGCLSVPQEPNIPGLEDFDGPIYRTGRWPHEPVCFKGLRVGVIGTGSSAIQAIPVIAREAAQVVVFQRTPNFSVPARNAPLNDEQQRARKARYAEQRRLARTMRGGYLSDPNDVSALQVTAEERARMFETRWERGGFSFLAAFNDIILSGEANAAAAEFVRDRIRDIVAEPATAEMLSPTTYPLGTKRLCLDTGYFETFNRETVALVDLRRSPIETVKPDGIRTRDLFHAVDAIVLATGFDAMTGALSRIAISGRDGLSLRAKWEAGPRTYLGLMSADFPNLFMITGPGSPSVLTNMIVSIEHHVDWIAACLDAMRSRGAAWIEPAAEAEDAWVAHVNEVAHRTLYPQANSWYMGANIPGKPRIFMPYIGGFPTYCAKCDDVVQRDYEGFVFGKAELPQSATGPIAAAS